jgi:hypothetical protein
MPVAILYLSIEQEHRMIQTLKPGMFALVLRLATMEVENLKEYGNLLEEAARLSEKHGWDSKIVDEYIKQNIEKLLGSRMLLEESDPPKEVFYKLKTCPNIGDCTADIIGVILKVERWLGSTEPITLAVQEEDYARTIIREYERRTGRSFAGRIHGGYKAVLARSRIGHHKLSDLGYIIVVARAQNRTLQALSRLEGYPYHATFLYHKS